jgi:hypothetical protein
MRKVDSHIIELFKEKQEMSFSQIFRELRDRNYIHYQGDISKSLKRMIKQGYLARQEIHRWHTRYLLLKPFDEVYVNVKIQTENNHQGDMNFETSGNKT